MIEKIYVDLDGVLVDFDKGVHDVIMKYIDDQDFLSTLSDEEKTRAAKFHGSLSKDGSDGVRDVLKDKANKDVVRKFIAYDGKWWENLDWMPDGRVLWDFLKSMEPTILTSSLGGTNASSGKTKWVHDNLGPDVKLIIIDDKEELASPNAVLIDDRSQIANKFKDAGGNTILHTSSKITILELKKMLGLKESKETEKYMDINEAEKFLRGKVTGRVFNFSDFVKESLNESDSDDTGYGQQPFYFAKNGDTHNYFFKIKSGQESSGFVVSLGKFAKFTQPTEQKTDFAVLGLTALSDEDLDQAVVDQGKFVPNDTTFKMSEKMLSKFFDHLAIIVNDYLQKNPRISKFYDELQSSLEAADYDNKFSMSLAKWPGEWHLQTLEPGKLNVINK